MQELPLRAVLPATYLGSWPSVAIYTYLGSMLQGLSELAPSRGCTRRPVTAHKPRLVPWASSWP